jgi:hypothetical protein
VNAPTIPNKAMRSRIIETRRFMQAENKKWPSHLVEVPRHDWPEIPPGLDSTKRRIAVWRSNRLLVQVIAEPEDVMRLSINRTDLDGAGGWKEGFSWDELQAIKDACGFVDRDAVEVFPARGDLVNVANIRHLWVLPYRLPFAWRSAR